MVKRTNLLVLILVFGLGVLLTYLLFFRFHILFIFLLFPLIMFGSFLKKLFRPWRDAGGPEGPEGRGQEARGQANRGRSYPEKQKEYYKKDYKVYEGDEEETGDKS